MAKEIINIDNEPTGTEIKPGLYDNLSNEEYHKSNGISKSGLSLLLKSPLHYHEKYSNQEEDDPTPAQLIGRAVHTAILEPDKFNSSFAVAPEINRRTKAGKIEFENFQKKNKGKTILSKDDHVLVQNVSGSVFKNKTSAGLLLNHDGGVAEQSVYWKDELTGVLCKCRPDFRRNDCIVIDIKTTKDASPGPFSRDCANLGYHLQAAMYLTGVTAATGIPHDHFIFIAVEKVPPFAVAVYSLETDAIQFGKMIFRDGVQLYSRCLNSGSWPGFPDKVTELELPVWAYR